MKKMGAVEQARKAYRASRELMIEDDYNDMTLRLESAFGIDIESEENYHV